MTPETVTVDADPPDDDDEEEDDDDEDDEDDEEDDDEVPLPPPPPPQPTVTKTVRNVTITNNHFALNPNNLIIHPPEKRLFCLMKIQSYQLIANEIQRSFRAISNLKKRQSSIHGQPVIPEEKTILPRSWCLLLYPFEE
jgi:hypothetical protein